MECWRGVIMRIVAAQCWARVAKTAKYAVVDCRVIKSVIKESRTFIEAVSKQ